MKKTILLLVFSLLAFISYSQTWDGGGDGHSWNDALNWNNDVVPATGDLVVLKGANLTIDGTVPNNPGQIKIATLGGNPSSVVLDLDITIGDGTIAEHAVIINSDCSITFGVAGNSRTVNINTPDNKNGINIFGSQTNASFTIASSTTVNISNSQHGINLAGDNCSGVNDGTMTFSNCSADGIHLASASGGSLSNTGSITVTDAGSDGIESTITITNSGTISIIDANVNGIYNKTGAVFNNSGTISITNPGATTNDGINSEAEFNNSSSGSITVDKPGDDCIELTGDTFTNDGDITVTIEDAAGSANNGIAVGTATSSATFVNNSNNSMTAHGGSSPNGRAIYVFESGTLNNNGKITVDGGNDGSTIYSRGILNNIKGATIDLTAGRINSNTGSTFTNDGFVVSTKDGAGVYTTGTSVNNGFVDWNGNSNNFSTGTGSITDNGIVLDNTAATISTGDDGDSDDCTADIAEVDYLWNDGTNNYQATSTGKVTFSSSASSLLLKTTEYGDDVQITVNDVCTSLPLVLNYFKAEKRGDYNEVSWETFTESNLDYFEIQKSDNALDFEYLTMVKSVGNERSGEYYSYLDKDISYKTTFYRLVAYDLDGNSTTGDIVSVVNKKENDFVNIFPTMLKNTESLNIELDIKSSDRKFSLTVLDIKGRVILKKDFNSSKGNIDLSGFNKGVYVVRINTAGNIFIKKFLIVNW